MNAKNFGLGLCALLAVARADAMQFSRMSDKSVEKLMEQVGNDVERFTKSIDSKYRKATIRSATGEVEIESYLEDMKDDAKKMRDRFDANYSASMEVGKFLQRVQGIESRSASGMNLFGAESDWPRLKGSSEQLGRQYGIDVGTNPGSWQPRRMNDDELEKVVKSLEDNTKPFKKQLGESMKQVDSISKAQRDAALKDVDRMKDAAEDLRKAVDKQADPSGSLAQLNSVANEVEGFVSQNGLSGAVSSSWGTLAQNLTTIRSAFSARFQPKEF